MSGEKGKQSADLSNFIDEHLRELRWTSYGLGSFAVLFLIGKLKATKKFTSVSQIPSDFIAKNYTLQGHVRCVTDSGVLKIEHMPIIEMKRLPSIFKGARTKDESLQLSVLPAGLDLTPDAVVWLKSHAPGKHAWFQMFARDTDTLYCDIRVKKGYFGRLDVSSSLVKLSLCKVQDFESPPDGEYFHRYLRKMIALEHKAAKKGKGIWKEEDSWLKRKSSDLYSWGTEKLKGVFRRHKS